MVSSSLHMLWLSGVCVTSHTLTTSRPRHVQELQHGMSLPEPTAIQSQLHPVPQPAAFVDVPILHVPHNMDTTHGVSNIHSFISTLLERHKDTETFHPLIHSHMAASAGTEAGQSQKRGIPSGSAAPRDLSHHLPVHQQEARGEAEQPGLKPVPDVGRQHPRGS